MNGGNGRSLAALLLEHPAADDEPLLHAVDRTVTAGEARAAAAALATRLRGMGVGPGQAVAVQLANGPDVVVAMMGIWLAGAVFVPINPAAPATETEHAVAATTPVAFVEAGAPLAVRAVEPAGEHRCYDPTTAFITWTSGTTGRPKAILHTHAGYLELLDRVLRPLRAESAGRPARTPSPNLIPVPMSLNSGIYNALFGLRAGSSLVVMEKFRPAEFARLVGRFAIRSTVLPPAAIAMLNDSEVTDLTPLRYVRSITAPLSALQARRFTERFGAFVLNGYGQAEIGEVIGWTAADAKAHPGKVGAVGRPHPGVAVRIETDGGEAGVDEVGTLRVRPPTMAAGYATGEDFAHRVDAEGFVDTGDLARVDADGFVWIEGRAGDLINRGGHKVFPEQVEEVLLLSPAVAEVAVVGRRDERLGEVPVAVVVDAPGVPAATDGELAALCREHLVPYKVPVAFPRVARLPRTEVGKVRRKELAAGLPA
jgi:acyl-CoA synthetase (AMP-forming)/AMP-acid ligase II